MVYKPNVICPFCGEDSGIPRILGYVGPPLHCEKCGKKLWEETRIEC